MIKLEKSALVAWDDPRGWGFCENCAFQEPVDVITSRVLEHSRSIGNTDRPCDGSGHPPSVQPGPEAHPAQSLGWRPKLEPTPEVEHGPEPEIPEWDE